MQFHAAFGQEGPPLVSPLENPGKIFGALEKKAATIGDKLDRQTEKYLQRLEKQERKLQKMMWEKDSNLAKQSFGDIEARYEAIRHTQGLSTLYSGHLDSLTTSLRFIGDQHLASQPELEKSLAACKGLQERLNASKQINEYIAGRQRQLKQQFEQLGMVKEVKGFQKQAYYYSAQVKEYKALFEDPSKLEEKLIEVAIKLPKFKEFFRSHSMLGGMFALPGGASGAGSINGLQTVSSVSQSLVNRFGSGANVTQMMRQHVHDAQSELNTLKNKVSGLANGSSGSGSDKDLPSFKPNTQKTKSFLDRLECGFNVQSQKSSSLFPVTSDIGLSLGYKLNDQSTVGVGASYKLGWGRGFEHIRITHQGVGLRSYLDYQIKGSLYISGGYELNYKSEIRAISQLKDYSAWQRSGLLGLCKKYKVSKKLKGDMKLMWDFLSYQQVPRTQTIVFRIGYSLK